MRIKSWIRRHQDASVVALYALLCIPLTYPLIFNLNHAVPGHGSDDPYLVWNLWWVKWALLDLGSNPLFSNYIFYPIGVNLGTYTLTLLNGVLSIPLQLAWDVIPANDLVVLFSITIAAFGTYLLTTELLGRKSASARCGAIAAGLVYGFGAYRFNYLYLGHFNFNSNEWLPFYVLYLQRIFKKTPGSLHPGAMAGLFMAFVGWTESTLLAFMALLTVLYLLFRLSIDSRHFFRRPVIVNLMALGAVALLGLLPLILAVAGDLARYGNFLSSGPLRAEFLSADLLSFFIPSQYNPLLGWLSKNLPYHNMDFAFSGYVTLLLGVIGFVSLKSRAEIVFWGIAGIVFALIMLGPVLHVANQGLGIVPLPYRLIQSIPLLGANRLPVRYDHLVMLAAAILAGGGVCVVLTRFPGHAALFVLIPALIVVEHMGIPLSMSDLSAPAVYGTIAAEQGDLAVLDLPLSWSSSTAVQGELYTQSQFYQTVHHKRLLGGNTSRPPPFEFQYFNQLPIIHSLIQLENGETLDERTVTADMQAAPELARFFGLRYVVARLDKLDLSLLDYVRRVFHLTPIYADNRVIAFTVDPAPVGSFIIDPAKPISQMYFDDEWGDPQAGADGNTYRWATSSGAVIYAPLAASAYQLCGLYAGARDGQVVRLSLGGVRFAELALSSGWEQHCVMLPAHLARPGINSLAFDSDQIPLANSAQLESRLIGQTGVAAPVDIAVTSAGFDAGKFASIAVNGHEAYATKRGFYLMAVDARRPGVPAWQVFDTFRDASESARMANYIRGIPAGTVVAGAVSDEASQNLNQEGVQALASLGLTIDLRPRFRASYAFIAVKGAAPGTALEAIDSSLPVNVSAGKDVTRPTVTFALGTLQFTQVQR